MSAIVRPCQVSVADKLECALYCLSSTLVSCVILMAEKCYEDKGN